MESNSLVFLVNRDQQSKDSQGALYLYAGNGNLLKRAVAQAVPNHY